MEIAKLVIIVIAAALGTCILLIIGGIAMAYKIISCRRANTKLRSKLATILPGAQADAVVLEMELKQILPSLLTRFTYEDLIKATNNFSNLLGSGGFGCVYKGQLDTGRHVAIKVLQSSVLTKPQTKQFVTELACVGTTSHTNVVHLIGFCLEYSQRLLVYEYVEGGSLDQWIFQKEEKLHGDNILDWKTRYNIAIGIVRGLHYLHEECRQPIMHFDIKPSNILLDKHTKVPKLADFGLSRLIENNDISQILTGVRGTPGYMAPEWLSHGSASKKTDIYSLGIVLLELIAGRRNSDISFMNSQHKDLADQWHFAPWAARRCEQGSMEEVIDRHLQGCFDGEQAQRLIFTVFWCIHVDPEVRPNIRDVLQWLEGTSHVSKPYFSHFYNGDDSQSNSIKSHQFTLLSGEQSRSVNNVSSSFETKNTFSSTNYTTSSTFSSQSNP